MNLSWVQQKNRPRRKDVIPPPTVGAHPSAVDDADRRHPVKVPCKLIIFVGTVKKFDAIQAAMSPYPGPIFASQRPLSMVFLDL
jgi:hypothetical protein